jgi:hypothetical protein
MFKQLVGNIFENELVLVFTSMMNLLIDSLLITFARIDPFLLKTHIIDVNKMAIWEILQIIIKF